MYSGTSDSGPSEMGTVCNRALYKGHCLRSQIFTLPIALIQCTFACSEKRTNEFILSPTCHLFRGFTVFHFALNTLGSGLTVDRSCRYLI